MTSVSGAPRLIALDVPVSLRLCDEISRIWDAGDVVLPLDQRMLPAARRRLADALGADEIVRADATERLAPSPSATLEPLVVGDALVIATSGSTGAPKGVVHTHHTLQTHAEMVGRQLGLSTSDHWWLCLPAAHIGGFGVIARALQFGSALSCATRVDDDVVRAALAGGATHTAIVPTLLVRHSFTEWKLVLVGGARAPALPANALGTYGLTETCGGVVYDGSPLAGVQVRVDAGHVFIRTPTRARTYRHAPLMLNDGWLDTGDVGVLLDGRLRIEGRRDDLIITGGNKVWPHVVETRLREHPLVADAVVRGVPDEEWGSIVCAWITPASATIVPTLEVLRNYVRETLASYYAPRKVNVVAAIPRTPLGKVIVTDLPE